MRLTVPPIAPPEPLRPSQRFVHVEKIADHFAEPEGRQHNVDPAQAQGGDADHHPCQDRGHGADDEGSFQGPVQLHRQEGRNIGADRHEPGIADGKLVRRQDGVDAQAQKDVDSHKGKNGQFVISQISSPCKELGSFQRSTVSLPKRCIKSVVRIPPHPALSPGIGGEGQGEGEIRDEDGIHRR
jgi:hypothetical protein